MKKRRVTLKPGQFVSSNEAWQFKHVEFQEMKAQLTEKILQLKKDLKDERDNVSVLEKQVSSARIVLAKSQQEKAALMNRLDTALYAMTLMKLEIRKYQTLGRHFQFNEATSN